MRKLLIFNLTLILTLGLTLGVAFAQELGFKGVGGRAGFAKPEDLDGTISFGAHVDFGEIIENLKLYPSLEYFKVSDEQFGADIDYSFFSINGDVRYYVPSSGNLDFFGGGGIALHFSNTDLPSGFEDESQTDVGLNILGGIEVPASDNLMVGGEAKFIVSDQNGFKIQGYVTYVMP